VEEKLFFLLEVSALEKGHWSLTTERIGQHLAIGSCWRRDRIVFESLDLSRLRSRTVFGEWQSLFVSEKMRVLRVLDLENATHVAGDNLDLEKVVKILPRLKFLSLRGQKSVTRLPDSIGGLRHLQTLDIKGTRVIALPPSIIKLPKLQHIRASGVVPPRGMGKLTALHTVVVISISGRCGKPTGEEIKNLTQLRKLGVCDISQENIRHLFLTSHLESLSLSIKNKKGNRAVDMDGVEFPMNLQSLKIYGHVERLPRSIKGLRNLVKLRLELITSKREDIEVIGKLENLRTLRLLCVRKIQDAELQFHARLDDPGHSSSRLFFNLKVLEIACANCLHVMFGEGAMGNLELLTVHCNEPSLQLSGLERLVSLLEVSLKGSYDSTLKEAMQQQLDEHPIRPALKLEQPSSS